MTSKPTARRGAEQVAESAQALGPAGGDMWKSVAGMSLPAAALTELQSDYLKQATELWNQTLSRAAARRATGRSRHADHRQALRRASDWSANPAPAFTAQMYLLNARTLMQLAEAVEGDAKTKARVRFAVQQWIDAADARATSWRSTPRRRRRRSRPRARASPQGMQHLLNDMQQGPCVADRRERVRGRPQRGHHRGRGGVRERAVPAASNTSRSRPRCTSGRCCSCRRASTSSTSSTCSPRTR